jgi:uncharacterized RDD family membrane protein YckC
MRCPKCHYLSFEPEPRCRNCGYDLAVPESDLRIKPADPVEGPMVDLNLRAPAPAAASRRGPATLGLIHPARGVAEPVRALATAGVAASKVAARAATITADVDIDDVPDSEDLKSFVSETPTSIPRPAPPKVAPPRADPPRSPHVTTELPLFVKALPQDPPVAPAVVVAAAVDAAALGRIESDEPLVKVPASPRPPLGVRRSTPEPPKVRQEPRTTAAANRKLGPFDRDLLEDLRRVEKEEARQARAETRALAALTGGAEAGVVKRLLAAIIDTILLGAITAGVAWVTFKVCDVRPTDVGATVLVPLGAFLLLLNLGYLIMFTAAGGQTVGKMATGIRVIGAADEDAAAEQLTLRQAVYREILTLPSLLPLGVGLLPALFGKGLAVHDRLAHTRVVRA